MEYQLRRRCAQLLALSLFSLGVVGCTEHSSAIKNPADGRARPVPSVTGEPATREEMKQIVIDNFTFDPPKLTISVGTKVTWVNQDEVPHTATSTAKPRHFQSGTLDTEDKFSHRFTAPGTYDYFCAVHPKMTGQIIVK